MRDVSALLGFVGEVVGVNADAVSADEAGAEVEEVPFGAGGGEHVEGVDPHLVEDEGEFVHERDVEIALRVLDDLGGFSDFDGGCFVDTSGDDGSVHGGDDLECLGVLSADDFLDLGEGVFFVAGIDALGRVSDFEVEAAF